MHGKEEKTKVVPIVKEEAKISKLSRARATYSIKKEIDVQSNERSIFLEEDIIDIKEITVEKEIDAYPEISTDGELTIIPIVREVEVVTKKLILVKEIHITKKRVSRKKNIQYDTRTENVKITKDIHKKDIDT